MINAYLTDDITVKKITYGTWGGIAQQIDTEIKGRFNFETKLVRNLQGEQVVSTANVMLKIIDLQHKDKIEYEGKEYSILGIEIRKDFSKRYLLVNLA